MKNYQNIKAIDRELTLENGYFQGNMALGDIRRYALSKAQMKVEFEKIHSKEKLFLTAMNNQHEENMQCIHNYCEQFKQAMLIVSKAIDSAIKVSEQSGDYSEVCRLIELNCSGMERINDMEVKK